MAALAFLTLTENQGVFLKRTRQTNARDQLNFFLQGLVRDRALLMFSVPHPSNVKLRECFGDAEKKIEPKCDFGKKSPLYLVDLTDSTFQKVWTAPPETPALYDEHAQGCDPKLRPGQCRFEVGTYFEPFCPQNKETCARPDRIVVTYTLKQIFSTDTNINPLQLRSTSLSHGHTFLYNEPPIITSMPVKVRLSQVTPTRSFDVAVTNPDPNQKLSWFTCEANDSSLLTQCLSSTVAGKLSVTVRLRNFEVGKPLAFRLQIGNDGPAPNATRVYEIPVQVDPVCLTPWGAELEEGFTVTAYERNLVSANENCVGSPRVCTAGVLTGTGNYIACNRKVPANCSSPWKEDVAHGQSRAAFASPTVPYGQACPQETRTCNDGALSGTYQYNACLVAPPLACKPPWAGGEIPHGTNVSAYSSATVNYGQDCSMVQQLRVCNNGTLLGSSNYSLPTCSVLPPRNCTSPWGAQIAHGGSIEAYFAPQVPFGQSCRTNAAYETRRCNDSVLSGSFTYGNCTMRPN